MFKMKVNLKNKYDSDLSCSFCKVEDKPLTISSRELGLQ